VSDIDAAVRRLWKITVAEKLSVEDACEVHARLLTSAVIQGCGGDMVKARETLAGVLNNIGSRLESGEIRVKGVVVDRDKTA
jgi:hypothetical protein